MNRLEELFEKWRDGILDDEGVAEMNSLLDTPDAREYLRAAVEFDVLLLESLREIPWRKISEKMESPVVEKEQPRIVRRFLEWASEIPARRLLPWAAVFAVLVAGFFQMPGTPPVAELEVITGSVIVQREGRDFLSAKHFSLRRGDIIRTGDGSEALVKWRGEATDLGVGSGSELRLISIETDKHVFLGSGRLVASVAKQAKDHPMILKTPQGRVEVLGTRFELTTDENATCVEVESGRVLLSGAGASGGQVVAFSQMGRISSAGAVEVKNLPADKTLHKGLLVHWPLNEGEGSVAHDVSGNGRNGKIFDASWVENKAAGVPGGKGVSSKPVKVLGRGAYVRSPEWVLPSKFSVTLWLRRDASNKAVQAIFCNSAFRDNGFGLVLHGSSQKPSASRPANDQTLVFHTRMGSRSRGTRSYPLEWASDDWHFIALNVDQGAGRVELFFDGKSVSKKSSVPKGFQTQGPMYFGALPREGDHLFSVFSGNLRDIRVYDRLLDAEEIAQLAMP